MPYLQFIPFNFHLTQVFHQSVLKGQILVNGEEVEEADVAAKNGRIYTLDGVLIPPSILPILPHRCDENTYKIILVSILLG